MEQPGFVDPVCGMTVAADGPHRCEHDGQHLPLLQSPLPREVPGGARALSRPKPAAPEAPSDAIYTCPMHPEIRQKGPGSCPICGMALEPLEVSLEEPENPELRDMSRRFWVSAALTLPLAALAMSEMLPGMPLQHAVSPRLLGFAAARARDAGGAVLRLAVLRARLARRSRRAGSTCSR